MLHFWLSCLIKSFWDSAFFIGTNKTGISYTVIVGLISLFLLIKRHVEKYGWRSVLRNWLKLLGEGLAIGVGAFLLIWTAELIAAPYGLYAELQSAKNFEIASISQRLVELGRTSKDRENGLAGEVASLKATATEIKTECAVKEGVSQTLQKQNRDQQSTINGCLSQAMKLLTPEALKITPLLLDADNQNAALKTAKVLLIANKVVTPVNMVVMCNAVVQSGNVSVVGAGMLAGGTTKLGSNGLQVSISTPAWGPTSPLLATIVHHGGEDFQCSFNPR